MLGLRPPGLEFQILCLDDSVISIISPSSGGSPGPIQPICAQRWPKAPFISFLPASDIRKKPEYAGPYPEGVGDVAPPPQV